MLTVPYCRNLAAFVAAALAAAIPIAGASAQPSEPAGHAQPATQPDVYDTSADAKDQIAAALAKAKAENRRVLLQWGANWCSWCRLLHGLCESDKAIHHELDYEYDIVLIDIGKFDKNMDLAAAYGADLKSSGVPFLTVLDADGKVLANQETGALESPDKSKPAHDPAKVLKFLTDHQAAPLSAETVLNDALSRAKTSHKTVFVHFGAPWCVWCHRLEDWMARKDVAEVLARSFVPVKIDQDRMTGAADVFKRFNTAGQSGIPWTAFLDGEGRVITTSDGPDGNIGFPTESDEIAWFAKMLRAAGVPDSDTAALTAALHEAH